MAISPASSDGFSPSRVVRLAVLLVGIGAVVELLALRSLSGALSLTLAGAVAIINFHWLDVVLSRILRPGQPQYDRFSILRIIARLSLLAIVFAAIMFVPRIDAVAIALGFSALVIALIAEGIRGTRVEGG